MRCSVLGADSVVDGLDRLREDGWVGWFTISSSGLCDCIFGSVVGW